MVALLMVQHNQSYHGMVDNFNSDRTMRKKLGFSHIPSESCLWWNVSRLPMGIPDELLMFTAGKEAQESLRLTRPLTRTTGMCGRKMPRVAGGSGSRSNTMLCSPQRLYGGIDSDRRRLRRLSDIEKADPNGTRRLWIPTG